MRIAVSHAATPPGSASSSSGSAPVLRCRPRPEGLAKEDLLKLDGTIEEILPDGRFRVVLENDHRIIVYTAGKMRRYRIRTLVGDRVQVEMSPYDMEKGRLIYRERVASTGFTARRGNRR